MMQASSEEHGGGAWYLAEGGFRALNQTALPTTCARAISSSSIQVSSFNSSGIGPTHGKSARDSGGHFASIILGWQVLHGHTFEPESSCCIREKSSKERENEVRPSNRNVVG